MERGQEEVVEAKKEEEMKKGEEEEGECGETERRKGGDDEGGRGGMRREGPHQQISCIAQLNFSIFSLVTHLIFERCPRGSKTRVRVF